ncbi:MAG: DUF6678 family protein [Clostridiaceae bacterium]
MNLEGYQELMNNTKWEEIRLAMCNYPNEIQWRTKDIENGYISNWDSEWFYHFKAGGYKTIEWLEIRVNNIIKNDIVNILRKIHVVGDVLNNSIKVYGYKKNGFIDYL